MQNQIALPNQIVRPFEKLAAWLKSDLPKRYEWMLLIGMVIACRLLLVSI